MAVARGPWPVYALQMWLFLAFLLARPWIGVGLEAEQGGGVRISDVLDGPAQRAGVLAADRIVSIDGKQVPTPDAFIAAVAARPPGSTHALVLRRAGKEIKLAVTSEERPDSSTLLRRRLVGKAAPAVELVDHAGPHEASLTKLRGQVVLLDFWATWCGPCVASLPHLSALQARLGTRGLRVLGVTGDDWDAARRFATDQRLTYTVAADRKDQAAKRYGIYALPTYVLVGRDGVVREVWTGMIDDAAVERLVDGK